MIELNEPNKINWTISYIITGQTEPIIKGRFYDFIPEDNNYVCINGTIYQVEYKIYDFDSALIIINLKQLSKNL